jgi:hypothetical protein
MADAEAARIAKTEALFREVNERVAERAGDFQSDETEFVCECGDPACTHRITASLAEYEEVRESGDRFLVAKGHDEDTSVERIVARHPKFDVVQKLRWVGALVRLLNPRGETA